jgi:hypothetical protein
VADVVAIAGAQARKLFSDLSDSPFIALCFVDDDLRVYTKGMDHRTLAIIRKLLDLMEEEPDGKEQ